jgi:hypothetical protein
VSAIREHLAAKLHAKLQRYGVVVWDDQECAYAAVVDDVVPKGTAIARFEGSWFELRRAIEASLAGDSPPALLVYVPVLAPDPDPLEELRAVGAKFQLLLATAIRSGMSGQLTESRIEELGKQCSTIVEAEAATSGGGSESDARLVAIVGRSGTAEITQQLLSGRHDDTIGSNQLLSVVDDFFVKALGAPTASDSLSEARRAAFRHLVLVSIESSRAKLPTEISGIHQSPSAMQRKTCLAALEALQHDRGATDELIGLAASADSVLHLPLVLEWHDSLIDVDGTITIDEAAIREAIRRLDEHQWLGAANLAQHRLATSWWAQPNQLHTNDLSTRWRAIRAIASLHLAIADPMSKSGTTVDLVGWYEKSGWEVDAAYRQLELLRVTAGADLNEFDELFAGSRSSYEQWLDRVLTQTSTALANDAHLPDSKLQRHVHRTEVRGQTRTAYLLVDALRYELGHDLASRLGRLNAVVELRGAVAAVPTITPVGMAALTPGADVDYRVDLDADDRLHVAIGGERVVSVPERIKRLEDAHGKVADVPLDRLAQLTNRELRKAIDGSSLVLVRSTEIDTDGESDQLAASWGSFDSILEVLHTAVARLLHAGIERVVISADHGFLAVRRLGEDRRIDKPTTGNGEIHRRAWIGRGGTATESTVKIPLSDFGIAGDLDIIAPRGLGVFTSGGGLQFFHGGLSPQELIVPVITVTATEATAEPKYEIQLSVAGGQISTGIVAVTIQMTGDLFTNESGVRVALTQDGQRIARVVGGDGYDAQTETIDAAVDAARVITMQISENLIAGSTATLEVLDAATGVRLGKVVEVGVVANVIVEDEL